MAKWRTFAGEWADYPLRAGSLWGGRYIVERYLGMGSYGQAYAVRDTNSGMRLLLKRNRPSKKELGLLLLRRESDIMRRLSHPQIPRWHGYVKRRSEEGLLMELMEGESLERAAEEGAAFTERDCLRIARELMRPLGYLHEAGYVHRDVRIPNVVMQGADGPVVLIDYGLACRIGEELPQKLAELLGDGPGASPPAGSWNEVRRRMRKPYPSSDLYGVGHLMLFLLYAGYRAEEGQEERSWEEELALDPAVRDFIRKLLDDERGGGWSSASACAVELDRLLAGD